MEPDLVNQVAREYRRAKHQPNHPSYQAFIRETLEQFDTLYHPWEFILVNDEPYADSESMFLDMERKRLRIFTGGRLRPDNPLREPTKYLAAYNSVARHMTVNEVFRAVHDILGHGPTQSPFETFLGELQAYQNHSEQYSREALEALYSETMGQLCHYWAGFGFVKNQGCKIIPIRF